jgi:Sterol-sensing domain of SREBP cleavage-activation
MLPFTLLALGVDVYFEVIAKLGEVGSPGSRLTIPCQLSRTMQTCGQAIMMCITASASAGLIGSSSPFPGVTQYCYYSVRCPQSCCDACSQRLPCNCMLTAPFKHVIYRYVTSQ